MVLASGCRIKNRFSAEHGGIAQAAECVERLGLAHASCSVASVLSARGFQRDARTYVSKRAGASGFVEELSKHSSFEVIRVSCRVESPGKARWKET